MVFEGLTFELGLIWAIGLAELNSVSREMDLKPSPDSPPVPFLFRKASFVVDTEKITDGRF